MQTLNANVNPDMNPKDECNYCQMFMSQPNNHVMSHEKYFHVCQPNYYKIIYLMQQFVKCNNSIPFNQKGSLQANERCWVVATINPISHSRPVHNSTFFNVLIDKFCSCKHREIIIFAHNYFKNKT